MLPSVALCSPVELLTNQSLGILSRDLPSMCFVSHFDCIQEESSPGYLFCFYSKCNLMLFFSLKENKERTFRGSKVMLVFICLIFLRSNLYLGPITSYIYNQSCMQHEVMVQQASWAYAYVQALALTLALSPILPVFWLPVIPGHAGSG